MKKGEKCKCGCNCGCNCTCHHRKMKMKGGSMMYCLGFIGAAVYYIGTAATFGIGVIGFLKALVWPAFLVYAAMKYLGM